MSLGSLIFPKTHRQSMPVWLQMLLMLLLIQCLLMSGTSLDT